MDVDGIGLVLARASELRSKISTCIRKSPTKFNAITKENAEKIEENAQFSESKIVDTEAEEDELCSIRDAFESLESQLSSLQELQQQQFYERETAMAEIEFSRQKLLKKLNEYKGQDLEVISEATAFASEAVEDNNDLLLPPYPSRPSRSLVSENGFLSHFPSTRNLPQNGMTNGDPSNELRASLEESETCKVQSESRSPFRLVITAATKTILTLVGVAGVLSLAGFEPRIRKSNVQLKVLGLFRRQGTEGKRPLIHCPSGKVVVVEDGEARCLVKERVEIPFESVAARPNVNYGFG